MRATISEVLSMSDPRIAAELPTLRLKRNEDRRLHAGHLWIFSNEVDTQQTSLTKFKPGELVRVLAHNDRALGLAYVNPKSLISARVLSTWSIPDTAWLAGRIRKDLSDPSGKSISMFAAADQLLKGAALNAVQIAEELVANYNLQPARVA